MSGEKKKKKTIITVPTATVKVNEKYGKKWINKRTKRTTRRKIKCEFLVILSDLDFDIRIRFKCVVVCTT